MGSMGESGCEMKTPPHPFPLVFHRLSGWIAKVAAESDQRGTFCRPIKSRHSRIQRSNDSSDRGVDERSVLLGKTHTRILPLLASNMTSIVYLLN